jgi:hypothetical protein
MPAPAAGITVFYWTHPFGKICKSTLNRQRTWPDSSLPNDASRGIIGFIWNDSEGVAASPCWLIPLDFGTREEQAHISALEAQLFTAFFSPSC